MSGSIGQLRKNILEWSGVLFGKEFSRPGFSDLWHDKNPQSKNMFIVGLAVILYVDKMNWV